MRKIAVFVRYRFIPRAGEKYLTPDERKAKSASYLQPPRAEMGKAKQRVLA